MQQTLFEQQEALKRSNEQLRYEQELMTQRNSELTTWLQLFNQQQLDYLSKKQALTLQQFETEDRLATLSAQMQHFKDSSAAFEAEKAAFEQSQKLFEEEKAAFEEEKRNAHTANRQTVEALALQRERYEREELRLKGLSDEFERRAAELATTRPTSQQASAGTYPTPASASSDELYRRAERDGIRLNTRIAPQPRKAVSQPKEVQPAPIFNKGATLFKAALLTFCFLAIECLIVFFLKESLSVSIFYPMLPLALGLVVFAACVIIYASGRCSAAKLYKNGGSSVFTSVILYVIGLIASSMIAVYCKAPLSTSAAFLSYIAIPAALMTNVILFPIFYRAFASASAKLEEE